MRFDDDMLGERFYELSACSFTLGFTRGLRPECGVYDGSNEPFAEWGPTT